MSRLRLDLGKFGEEKSIQFLKSNGYKILNTNYKSKLGELDIVARDAKTICFIEVKTRSNYDKGDALESITPTKIRKLSKLAVSYLKENDMLDQSARFDVVSVYRDGDGAQIKLIKNAFELEDIYTY